MVKTPLERGEVVMELSYDSIAKMLDGEAFGAAVGQDGERIALQCDRVEGEDVYTATWETKRGYNVAWYVRQVFYKNGIVEELYEYMEV